MKTATWLSIPLLLCGCRHEQPYQKPLIPVTVEAVTEYRGGGGSRFSGSIEPRTRVDVAFKSGGYVEQITQVSAPGEQRDLQEGDFVKKDEVLARVRQSDYVVKVNQARSALAQANAAWEQARFAVKEAQAGVAQAKLDLDRATNLFRAQSLTKTDYDAANTRMEVSQARVDQAKSQLDLAQGRVEGAKAQLEDVGIVLRDTELRAPMDGWILKKAVEVGTLVGPGTPGFVLADISSVKVVFGAPDSLLPNLKLGLPLSITTEAIPNAMFHGRLTSISPAADPKSRVFDVEITIPNPRHVLKPGMIAGLRGPGETNPKPVPVVPLAAIVRSRDNPNAYGVFVLEKEGARDVPRARSVSLGEAFGNFIAVQQGVRPGELVVVSGAALVRDGEPVQVVR
jgi:RND family efflux transporter MFP subunit